MLVRGNSRAALQGDLSLLVERRRTITIPQRVSDMNDEPTRCPWCMAIIDLFRAIFGLSERGDGCVAPPCSAASGPESSHPLSAAVPPDEAEAGDAWKCSSQHPEESSYVVGIDSRGCPRMVLWDAEHESWYWRDSLNYADGLSYWTFPPHRLLEPKASAEGV